MRKLIVRMLNAIMALPYCFLKHVQVGANTQVAYWRLRGRNGNLRIGCDGVIHCRVDFDHPSGSVLIGDRCYIGASHLVCHTGIEIGNDVIISWGVTIVDHNSHALDWHGRAQDVARWKQGQKDWREVKVAPVFIGSKVWIGFGAAILKGVQIGEGAVIGAHAVVTRNVPAYAVVAGNPARIVQQRESST